MSDSDQASTGSEEKIDINIKASAANQKYNVSISTSSTVAQLKEVVSGLSNIPAGSQRLIYSGRVLKDDQTLGSYKLQNGHTVHLIKSAPAPSSSSSTSSTSSSTATTGTGASNTISNVPTNIAAGQGSGNILADLTGARYAGLAHLPSASMFGSDGGMGPPPSEEQLLNMMSTPGFRESMDQALQNPQMIDMLINSSPQLRPMAAQFRQMMQSPEFRSMMSNPDAIRQAIQMQRLMGGNNPFSPGGGAAASFPSPGSAGPDAASTTTQTASNDNNNTTTASAGVTNPAANPFAALFPGGQVPNLGALGTSGTPGTGSNPAVPADNPFSALLNPALFQGQGQQGSTPGAGGLPAFNPEFLSSILSGQGLNNPAPEDTRPPEERYAAQLNQLNELGFFDFDRNVRALRRSGGNVQGAIEALLDGNV